MTIYTSIWYFLVPIIVSTGYGVYAVAANNHAARLAVILTWIVLILISRLRTWRIVHDRVYWSLPIQRCSILEDTDARACYNYAMGRVVSATLFITYKGKVQYIMPHINPEDCRVAVLYIKNYAASLRQKG